VTLSYCETYAGTGVWHIRVLGAKGRRPEGGADTTTLCGLAAAWDVPSTNTPFEFREPSGGAEPGRTCRGCAVAYHKKFGEQG